MSMIKWVKFSLSCFYTTMIVTSILFLNISKWSLAIQKHHVVDVDVLVIQLLFCCISSGQSSSLTSVCSLQDTQEGLPPPIASSLGTLTWKWSPLTQCNTHHHSPLQPGGLVQETSFRSLALVLDHFLVFQGNIYSRDFGKGEYHTILYCHKIPCGQQPNTHLQTNECYQH